MASGSGFSQKMLAGRQKKKLGKVRNLGQHFKPKSSMEDEGPIEDERLNEPAADGDDEGDFRLFYI